MLFRCICIALFVTISFNSNAQNGPSTKINIVDFKVEKNQNKISVNWSTDNAVSVKWSTDNAVPTNYFEVEKSTDGKNFQTIAYVLGADPSKTDCDCYGCFDKVSTNKNESFYRLKHVSLNGEVEFSEVKSLAINN